MANSSANRLSLTIEDQLIESALRKLDELDALLPFLITLTSEERKKRVSLDVANKAFVEDALDEVKLKPILVPSFVDISEAQKDIASFGKLLPLRSKLDMFWQRLYDTMLVLGDEAWTPALRIYSNVKEARKNGVPGAEEAYLRLKKRFDGQGKPKPGNKQAAPPPPETPQ